MDSSREWKLSALEVLSDEVAGQEEARMGRKGLTGHAELGPGGIEWCRVG